MKNYKKAERDYLKGMKYKEIAAKYGVSLNTVKSWKTRYGWQKKSVHSTEKVCTQKRGAPKGNKNAAGHSGGGPVGNKKAVKTGEYETIWLESLSDEERDLYQNIDTSPEAQLMNEIKLFDIRIKRMLDRLNELKNSLPETEKAVIQELKEEKFVETKVTTKTFRIFTDIMRLEEALTRVQEKKQNAVRHLYKMKLDNELLKIKKQEIELKAW